MRTTRQRMELNNNPKINNVTNIMITKTRFLLLITVGYLTLFRTDYYCFGFAPSSINFLQPRTTTTSSTSKVKQQHKYFGRPAITTTTTTDSSSLLYTTKTSSDNDEVHNDKKVISEKKGSGKKKIEKDESNNKSNNNNILDCLVVGGGISGCTLAHNLYYTGTKNILLTEARDYLGGNVKSHITNDGFVWEEGPNSFATQPSIVRIAYELKIDNDIVFANEALPPWVNHNGKLHPLPKGQGGKGPKGQIELVFGPNGVLKFALLGDLLSWPGKIRAGIGAFLGHTGPPPNDHDQETIREWVTRILGEEVFLRCIDPFVSGVYAGDPQSLSMKAALPKIARIEDISYSIGWNIGGAIFYGGLKRQIELTKERKANPPAPEWIEFEYGNPGSFRKGLSTLPNAISIELGQPLNDPNPTSNSKVRLLWKMIKLEKGNNNDYYVATFDTPTGLQTVRAKTVVSTIPAHALKGVFTSVLPEVDLLCTKIRQEINRVGIYYPPVAAVTVAYPKKSFKDVELPNGFGNLQNLPGFGNLNPRTEGVRTLGTLWSSSLFPERAPDDYNLLLNYIGGSRDASIANMTEQDIIDAVDKGCRDVLLQPNAPPPKVLGLKLWPTAIPQYEKGHIQLIQELEDAERKIPGLWICGNYRTGVAFPDCVTWGYEHSKIVSQYLTKGETPSSSPSSSSSVSISTVDMNVLSPAAAVPTPAAVKKAATMTTTDKYFASTTTVQLTSTASS